MTAVLPTPDDLRGYLKNLDSTLSGFSAAGGTGWIVPCDEELTASIHRAAPRPPAGMSICKFGSRSVVGLYACSGGELSLKYYYPRSFTKSVTYGIFGSRARTSWIAAHALPFAGIPTAMPLALLEWRSAGMLLNKSLLVTRHVAGTPLNEFVKEHAGDETLLSEIAGRLRGIFATMSRFRIAHGDLKATNILVGENGRVTFIDLDATAILIPENQWSSRRERDMRLFRDNWSGMPSVSRIFADVFQ